MIQTVRSSLLGQATDLQLLYLSRDRILTIVSTIVLHLQPLIILDLTESVHPS